MPFLHFCNYLPFEEDLAPHLNKLEFPSPKDNVYQKRLIEFGLLVLEILKKFQCSFTFLLSSSSPLGEGHEQS
jgi:hypothetical protein